MKTIIIIIIYHQDAAKTQRAQPYTQLKLIRRDHRPHFVHKLIEQIHGTRSLPRPVLSSIIKA